MSTEKNYFKTFCKISQAFGTAATEKALLKLIVKSAVESMDGKAACLFLADEDKDIFVPTAQTGLSKDYLHASPMKAQSIVSALVKKGHLAFKDATTDPRLENHAEKKKEGIASLLTVPVRVKNRTIGVLSLYTDRQRDFDSSEIEFLKALADQGGITIEKDRLMERIQKNAVLFLSLASSINSTLEITEVLSEMTVSVCDALGMKGATIRLLDEESGSLKIVASHGLSDTFLAKGSKSTTELASRASKGDTLIVEDATTDKRVQSKDAMRDEGLVSMIITPITAREKVIGILRLYSSVKRMFPEDLIAMVKVLAHQGGLAIQNASMYLKLQEDKKNLEEDVWSHRSWF